MAWIPNIVMFFAVNLLNNLAFGYNISVPVQICAPETDHIYTPELKEYSLKVLPTLGIEFDYQYFPGLVHGFAVRGDQNDPKQKKGLERAKNAAVYWFMQHLH